MQRMLDDGISTRRGVMNAHTEPAYPAGTWRSAGSLAESERAYRETLVLPLFHQMTDPSSRTAWSRRSSGPFAPDMP